MTDYLLLFRNASAANGYLASSDDMAKDMPLWQAWMGQMAQQGKLVHTAPVGYEAVVVNSQGIEAHAPYKEANSVLVSGYVLCKAESLEEVAAWSRECPILKYPHSTVEIRPLLPFQM